MRKWPTGRAGISLAIALAGRNDHAICADTYIYIGTYGVAGGASGGSLTYAAGSLAPSMIFR